MMSCYKPLRATRLFDVFGKPYISFKDCDLGHGEELFLPCGQCIGCRVARSREWATRLVHESTLHDENCFITLTYNPENLPEDGSLHKDHFQKFMKRLRKAFPNQKIRFFHCGEYGSKLGRPHYHAILFGFDFPDKELFSVSNGVRIYRSSILERLWPFGFSTIGDVTFESCAYVARYVIKKITGDKADEHYQGKHPEYITMSLKPGIASGWFEKYVFDIYPHDFVVLDDGRKLKTPRFYDRKLLELFPDVYLDVEDRRCDRAMKKRLDRLEKYGSIYEMYRDLKRKECAKRYKIEKRLPRNLEMEI